MAPNAPLVLPSIRELFPEHVPHSLPVTTPKAKFLTPFDVPRSMNACRSDPAVATIQQLAFTSSYHLSTFTLERVLPPSHSSSNGDADDDSGGSGNVKEKEIGRKYVCPTCCKRFNRPSTLRIHANTHTGATPFRCPHPGCGRAFNVNSNMRRHFRNHVTEASPFYVAPQGPHSSVISSPFSASPFPVSLASEWDAYSSPFSMYSPPTYSSLFSPTYSASSTSVSSTSAHSQTPFPALASVSLTTKYCESDVRGSGRW